MEYQLREVVVELTKQCNLNCLHCGSACPNSKPPGELTSFEWENLIRQLKMLGTSKIVFSGGEPTLKDGFENIIAFARNSGLKFGIITNGFEISKSLTKTIADNKPFAVGVSIDGLKKTHNLIRRNNESWQRAFRTISNLQELGVQVCVVSTISKLNHRELPRLAELLYLAEIDSWQLQLAMPSGRMRSQQDKLISEQNFRAVCECVVSFRKIYPSLNIQAADCFGLAPVGSIRSEEWQGCSAGIASVGIDSLGNVLPCLSLQSVIQCGNVRDKGLKNIWETSEGFDFNRKFSAESVSGKCRDCESLSFCRGGCASQSFSYYQIFHQSPFCFERTFCA
jgi:radical SAM protein with 4Fe4S-binding SPASM domain